MCDWGVRFVCTQRSRCAVDSREPNSWRRHPLLGVVQAQGRWRRAKVHPVLRRGAFLEQHCLRPPPWRAVCDIRCPSQPSHSCPPFRPSSKPVVDPSHPARGAFVFQHVRPVITHITASLFPNRAKHCDLRCGLHPSALRCCWVQATVTSRIRNEMLGASYRYVSDP